MNDDALTMLESDHRKVEDLFAETKGDSPDLEQLGIKIAQALLVHTEIEEKIFYPAVRERAQRERNKKEKMFVGHAFHEHRIVKNMLLELSAARGKPASLRAVLSKLEKVVLLHVTEEEKIMFPDAQKLFGAIELQELGRQMEEIKAHRPAA